MRNHRKNNVQTQDCPSQPSIIYVRPLYLYLCTTATDTSKLNYHAMRNRTKNYVQTQDRYRHSQPFIYVPLYLNLYTTDTDASKLECQAMRNRRKNYIQTQDCPSQPSIYIPLHLNLCTHDIHPISFPFPSYTQLPIQVHHRPTTQEHRRLFLNPSQLLPHIFLHIITPNLPKVIVAIQHIVHHHCLAPPPQIQPLNYIPPLPTADVVNLQAPVLEFESGPAFFDESKIIKKKPEEIEAYLDGRCIYLVGMMGSGKTTVGKVLSEFLGYTFVDCDTLIEEAVGGSTVAEIFNLYGESFFRDNETEILQKLSLMHRLVVATGGGAVVRPINWRHMRKGTSVWLDVPVEALACRITAVGTESRPLLHHGHGNPYTETMKRLSTLLEERGEAYANADVRVSLESMATKLGFEDAGNISPTVIAIEVLLQIENFLKK